MTVPKAPVNLNHCFVARKHKIGSARKICDMQAVSEAKSVQAAANQELRFGVLAPYLSHYLAPFFRRNSVRQFMSLENIKPF